jgi:hypothetical protein
MVPVLLCLVVAVTVTALTLKPANTRAPEIGPRRRHA